MRLTWLTDIHLEFLTDHDQKLFANYVLNQRPDKILLTGDMVTADCRDFLVRLQERVKVPIFYVLGNHDCYNGSIKEMRDWAETTRITSGGNIFWMHGLCLRMGRDAVMIGIDGWADGQLGNGETSPIALSDWTCIEEMSHAGIRFNRDLRLKMLKELGREEAETLRPVLAQALARNSYVYLLTHVPPWKEAAWHEGEHSDDNWLPWFTCKAVGDVIEELSAEHPGKKITVLCGHTHGMGYSKISDDIEAYTGEAEYYVPCVQRTFVIDDDGSYEQHSPIGEAWPNAKKH
jgi:predicted phosphodiesterase